MKPFIYPISEILCQPDFSERKVMIDVNVQRLGLGVVQSKRYFESVAILRQYPTHPQKQQDVAMGMLKRYHGIGR